MEGGDGVLFNKPIEARLIDGIGKEDLFFEF